MKNFFQYRFAIGAISIVAGLLSLACLLVGMMAVNYHFEAFSDPALTILYANNMQLVKWFNLLDMLGYYLLLLPLIFYFHQQYRYRTPWSPLITFSGLAYVLTGAIGAAILAAVWPSLLTDYASANPENKMIISNLFKAITTMVTVGMWNILEVLFAALWWMGLGKLIYSENKSLGVLTFIAGISTLSDALGNMFNLTILSEIGVNLYLILGIIWPIIIGIFLLKKSMKQPSDSLHHSLQYITNETA
ncbi:hypothetical protein [Solitalea lacus]|uniref:hypothetical protein n=1 Tax=Solitalea lacus TaxID=2911172 RepID=UPI001EDC8793|nr:hypothetical protein [Solitalea lacus]UKJ05800.1 hypothetical protein L2B55_09590 [Solitalea lacus]